jgi:hypothetical protein
MADMADKNLAATVLGLVIAKSWLARFFLTLESLGGILKFAFKHLLYYNLTI